MNKKNIIISLVILVGITLVGWSLLQKTNKSSLSGTISAERQENKNEVVKKFEIQAFRFGYNPDRLVVKKGGKVKLSITNLDTLHGIRIPDLNLKGNDSIEFTADTVGEFKWYCNNFCGEDHRQMQGTLIVEE